MTYSLSESVLLIAILINTSILFLIGRISKRGAKFLAYTLSFYWFISYLLRPIIFIFSRNANIESAVYDDRIANDSVKFCSIMLIINFGCSEIGRAHV